MFKIEEIKGFMALLFLKENFDEFHVGSMEVKTFIPVTIKGNLIAEWLGQEEQEKYGGCDFVPWKLLRPVAFSLIKGKQTPGMLRIQFIHYMENGDCGGLRVQYENGELVCISSYTPVNFTLDKSSEQLWDEKCSEFLRKNQIISTRL